MKKKNKIWMVNLAGEWKTLLGANCVNRWKDGAQWHELFFLGKYWDR